MNNNINPNKNSYKYKNNNNNNNKIYNQKLNNTNNTINNKTLLKQSSSQSKNKLKIIPNSTDKIQLSKEIKEKNLLINDSYTKSLIDIDIKFSNNNNNHPTKLKPINQSTISNISSISNNTSITTNYKNYKIDKLFHESLEKIKNFRVNFDEENFEKNFKYFKEEIIFLKTKNEILKLKSNFYENVFYGIKNLIENENNNLISENINNEYKKNLLNKIMCILNQNNKYYYEQLNFNKLNETISFDFNDNIDDKINTINLKVLEEIEKNLQNILNKINNVLNEENINKNILINLKENLIFFSKKIISYYFLSNNFVFEFKHKNKFIINTNEEIYNNEIKKRKENIIKEFDNFFNSLLHKVLNKKNKNDFIKLIKNFIGFYENYNKLLSVENINLKNFQNEEIKNINNKLFAYKKSLNEFCIINNDKIDSLKEIFEYIETNGENLNANVAIAMLNTEKKNFNEFILDFKNLYEFNNYIINLN